MPALRKGNSYSKRHITPYTRKSKKKAKSYIKAVPPVGIVKYSMGNERAYDEGKFSINLIMVADEQVQVRDSALESCRQSINKKLENNFKGQYFFKIYPYPHQVQRENKMYSGGSKGERVNTGMQLAFGKATDRAAILKRGDIIFLVATSNKQAEKTARKLLKDARLKLPCKTKIISKN